MVPSALPYDFDGTSSLSQDLLFLEGGLVDFMHGMVMVTDGMSVAVNGKAWNPWNLVYGRSLSDGIAGDIGQTSTLRLCCLRCGYNRHWWDVEDAADVLGRPTISGLWWTGWIVTLASLGEVRNRSCSWGPISCTRIGCRQGTEKNGRWNARSALERCVMRRETGLRAHDCDTVQKMAAKEV